MKTEILKEEGRVFLATNGKKAAEILPCEGCSDSFERLSDLAFLWKRKSDSARIKMRMELLTCKEATFTMVPSVSYNGNGWGSTPEYVGDRAEDGTPWSFAWHRVTIPSCTFSATPDASVAMMAEAGEDTGCSLYREGDREKHVLIYPEEDAPKTLQRHFWGDAYYGEGKPRTEFTAIILAYPAEDKPIRYDRLLDFAWRYYGHPIKAQYPPEELKRLSLAYMRFLFSREQDGFCGFTMGSQWHYSMTAYLKTVNRYEISWVGQSASMANAMLKNYLETGDKESLQMGLEAHDAWIKYGTAPCGILESRIDRDPWRAKEFPPDFMPDLWKLGECQYESQRAFAGRKFRRGADGLIALTIDACNLGGAADAYFEAYDLARECGYDKPEYLKTAFDICEFAMKYQSPEGGFVKNWTEEGAVIKKDGTVGCFLVLPLITAYNRTKEEKYLDSAKRAFDYYYGALEKDGYTTAGALDTYCIDKESSSPMLRDALALYDVTKDQKYVTAAENIAWYLSTWIMHYTIVYPEDSLIAKMPYDTFASTSVSTAHQALDQYALRDVISFKRLAELTGNVQWKEKAAALWANANQGISDGTMYLNGRLRPAGSQDEAVFHTRWGRHGVGPFRPSQWLPAWPTAFRMEDLRWSDDWEIYREGLTGISGKIEHK